MPAYAIALLNDVEFNAEIVAYIRGIDATLPPFGGRFLVHGCRAEVKEGAMDSDCIIIAFPSIDEARRWYASPAYERLIPLRARNARGAVFLIDGVPGGYLARALLDKLAPPEACAAS